MTVVVPLAILGYLILVVVGFTGPNSRGRAGVPHWLSLPDPKGFRPKRKYRTVWVSDIHLGTKGCNAAMLIDFLDHVDSDTMYLVGDIIDGWRLKKKFYWPAAHNDIVWRIMKRARRGTRVVYIPGNHDEMFRQFTGLNFGGIEIRRAAFHDTADGRRLMVLHGDEFDAVMLSHRWLAFVGDHAYHLMMKLNVTVNTVRRWMGKPYWSLSKAAKHKVKNAVEFIGKYEEVVARAAGERGVDGVVCGHIHTAEFRMFEHHGKPVEYWNDGDWVEGCNALVEHHDGRMEILHWPEEMKRRERPDAPVDTHTEICTFLAGRSGDRMGLQLTIETFGERVTPAQLSAWTALIMKDDPAYFSSIRVGDANCETGEFDLIDERTDAREGTQHYVSCDALEPFGNHRVNLYFQAPEFKALLPTPEEVKALLDKATGKVRTRGAISI